MAEVLLSSEKFIKSVTNVSDNLAGKFLMSSLREAQAVKLKGILGTCLYRRLKDLVSTGFQEPGSEPYKELLDECQYFLAYSTMVEIVNKVSYKINNAGVTKTSDQNIQNASDEEIISQMSYYQAKADGCAYNLQSYLLEHKSTFPELKGCDCERISSNLYSAATCGMWLGGARGKARRSRCACDGGRRR